VGSSILTKYEYQDGKPVLMREPKVFFNDDSAGKAIGINLFIGKRPCARFWQLAWRSADAGVDPGRRWFTVDDVGLA
jgi:hypothetical protein